MTSEKNSAQGYRKGRGTADGMYILRQMVEKRLEVLELELEFYLFDRQLHNIGEIISKCKIILSGDSHKGTNWPLT